MNRLYLEATDRIQFLDACIDAFPLPLQIGVTLHNPVVDFKQLENNLECCFDHPRYTVVFNLLRAEDRTVVKSFFRRVGLRRNLTELLIQDFSQTHRLDASDGFWQGGCWLECHQDFLQQLQEAGIIRGYCSEATYLRTDHLRVERSRARLNRQSPYKRLTKSRSFFEQPLE